MTHNEQDVERVARAVRERINQHRANRQICDMDKEIAKAALSAMQKPTQYNENMVGKILQANEDVGVKSFSTKEEFQTFLDKPRPTQINVRHGKFSDNKQDEWVIGKTIFSNDKKPCPHVHTSAEGTSYCDLAESSARRMNDIEQAAKGLREAVKSARAKADHGLHDGDLEQFQHIHTVLSQALAQYDALVKGE